ncbi:MAG: DUF4011 domain-containing protein [Vicinamibacteria bacterium]|nr:DUF4011 domain-containing protein [Vicinamibacteria bacterium]
MTAPGPSPARRAKVAEACKRWIEQLIDLSRRNNLLYFRDLKAGTLALDAADRDALRGLLSGETVSLAGLLPEGHEFATANLRKIADKALENLEERGLDTLFLAVGMVSWAAKDEGRPAEAPLFLVPVRVERRGYEARLFKLVRGGDVQVNSVLLHVLLAEHGVRLAAEDLVGRLEGDDPGETLDLAPAFDFLRGQARSVPGFVVRERYVLGNFAFQKMAIVNDLRSDPEALAANELIAAVAGDPEAARQVRGAGAAIGDSGLDARNLDQLGPEEEFLILDADSSQQVVIRKVLGGESCVIQGPPGTGKSQTIANLIAELAARGRRVLFVAEKRAALDVVLHRLDRAGLGHLALDLHGAELSRRAVMAQLGTSLQAVKAAPLPDSAALHESFLERRRKLVAHVERMHVERSPFGRSAFAIQAELLALRSHVADVRTRWRGAELARLTATKALAIENRLRGACGHSDLLLGVSDSPWLGATLDTAARAGEALDALAAVREALPEARQALRDACGEAGLGEPASIEQAEARVAILRRAQAWLQQAAPQALELDLADVTRQLAPARSTLRGTWAFLTDAAYRAARSTLRERAATSLRGAALLDLATEGAALQGAWAREGHGTPRVASGLSRAEQALAKLAAAVGRLRALVPSARAQDEFEASQALAEQLQARRADALRLPAVLALKAELEAEGLGRLMAELAALPEAGRRDWPALFRRAWLESGMDEVFLSDPALAAFQGRTHDELVADFRRLDRERIAEAVARVKRAHAERVIEVLNREPQKADRVTREVQKKARHMPLRKLIEEAGEVLTALRPCWMASPLSVSQLMPPASRIFDVVLFDEASQVLPWDAAAALMRAPQAVVAGDSRQLPPTTFFAAGDDGDADADEGDAEVMGYESLLDQMSGCCAQAMLKWHYRSRDESLIAFSNRHIYDAQLVTLPGPHEARAVTHVLVQQAPGTDGQAESAGAEVERVVDLILDHARRTPEQSLGVIAMGLKHADRVQAALDRRLQASRDRGLDAFFDTERDERFFVKNLERVQGDERDAILLTVGYGKDASGRLPYRFGPLLYKGGERRLNVAITRARDRLTLVSSFSHLDMDPNRTTAEGVELLRLYLQFAASGGRTLGEGQGSGTELNGFELDVQRALEARGLSLLPQWGASRYRIDFAVKHPERPGELVLAIECDGASYHAAPTARDRDRLRQQHLEALGWRFHRIWSTDWFQRREEEIERTVRAYERALAEPLAPPRAPVEIAPPPPAGLPGAGASAPAPPARRLPKPQLAQGLAIDAYSDQQLVDLMRHLRSDGRLRTDEELVREAALEHLGFKKLGSRIRARLTEAAQRTP